MTEEIQTNKWDVPLPLSVGIAGKLDQVLKSGFLSDVTIYAGESKTPLKVHKLILAFSSRVFEAMFYGPACDLSDSVIISDIDSEAFIVMLEYIYVRHVRAKLPLRASIQAFYAARKYELPDLEKFLFRNLIESVTVDTAAALLSTAKLFDLVRLENKCWECIELDSSRFLESDEFLQLDSTLVKEIISRDNLNVSESQIYKAALNWANEECRRRELSCEQANKRLVLQDILPAIRFPLMDATEFANGPAFSGILMLDEISNVWMTKYATVMDKPMPLFSPKKRHPKLGISNLRCNCQTRHCGFCLSCAQSGEQDDDGTCKSTDPRRLPISFNVFPTSYCSCRTRGYCPAKKIG